MKRADLQGAASPRFDRLRDAFAATFSDDADFPELGARFTAFVDGEAIVDLWGGFADRRRETPWTDETLACIYSSGKAVAAYLVARAVSDGALDYDAPVASIWPAFGAAGKEKITLAEALSHQAGLCGFAEPMDPSIWLDHAGIASRIASMAPLWAPGSAQGYHPQTVGFIANEVLRRATGRTIGQSLSADFWSAFGFDIHCGADAQAAARAAVMPKPPAAPDLGPLTDLKRVAFLSPWSSPAKVSREDWMAAELPASNMHATARALAEIVHPLACAGEGPPGRALDPAAVREALRIRTEGQDLVLPFRLAWAAGLMANRDGMLGPGTDAFGHYGFGGSCVVIDPARRLSAAYVMNRMSPHLVADPRPLRLLAALYDAL